MVGAGDGFHGVKFDGVGQGIGGAVGRGGGVGGAGVDAQNDLVLVLRQEDVEDFAAVGQDADADGGI